MEKKLDVKLTFADNILPDMARDTNSLKSLNDWLAPIIPELIKADVTAELYLDERYIQHLTFSKNISEELLIKADEELRKYQFRLTNLIPKS